MKKIKYLLFSLILLSAGFLIACNDNKKPNIPDGNNEETEEKPQEETENPNPPIKDKFEIITSTYGLYIEDEKGSFVVSNATKETNDDFNFPLEVLLHINDDELDWVTLFEEPTIEIEDEKIIPINAIKIEEVTNSDIVGSSGTNAIEHLKVSFDRTLLNVGKTKIKIKTKFLNGNANGTESVICFEMDVKEYGTIDVSQTCNVTLNFKIKDFIDDIKDNMPKNCYFQELFIFVGYQNSDDFIFGSNCFKNDNKIFQADDNNLDISDILKDFSFENLKLADNVTYVIRAQVRYRNEKFNNNETKHLKAIINNENISSKYEKGDNILDVKADNVITDVKFEFVD